MAMTAAQQQVVDAMHAESAVAINEIHVLCQDPEIRAHFEYVGRFIAKYWEKAGYKMIARELKDMVSRH